jgi:hypothetical protein
MLRSTSWSPHRSGVEQATGFAVAVSAAPRYDWVVTVPRTRRIWYAETASLCQRLETVGAWQAALRVRVAHGVALSRRPDGSAYDFRATREDEEAISEALYAIRAAQRT